MTTKRVKILSKLNYGQASLINDLFGEKVYNQVMRKIFQTNIKEIKYESKIRVAFIVALDTTWSGDFLYQYLEKSKRFVPFIIIAPFIENQKEYRRIVKYYKEKKYKVISYKQENYKKTFFKDKKVEADIYIHSNPYIFRDRKDLNYMPLNKLHVFIPYAFWLDESSSEDIFHFPLSNCYWKFFCQSLWHKKEGIQECSLGKTNMKYVGYPKMDHFYMEKESAEEGHIWKVDTKEEKEDKRVKIIYAPGLPFGKEFEKADFSTFSMNYKKIYNLAKEREETTVWVYKPHPLLKSNAVRTRIFRTEKEYEEYEKKWDLLPNASVFKSGEYYELFATSDGMILDSKSFVSGYQYVHKPLLFLEKGNYKFNKYGKKIMEILYTAKGDDIQAMEQFIDEKLILGKDNKKMQRNKFYAEYLDYKSYNCGKLSSEKIYEEITKCF